MNIVRGIAKEALQVLIPLLSAKVRKGLEEMVDRLESLAAGTENEYDDLLVDLLRAAVEYPGPNDES